MLVVELDALGGVDVLDRPHEGVHRGLNARELAELAEVHETLGELVAGADLHLLVVLDGLLDGRCERDGGRHLPLGEDAAVVLRIEDAQRLLGLLGRDLQHTRIGGEIRLASQYLLVDVADDVEHARDSRQALRDVARAGDAARVDRPHRELSSGLANGLCGDDAHRGTDADGTPRGEVPAVAFLADPVL